LIAQQPFRRWACKILLDHSEQLLAAIEAASLA
jgi:hypothetical protein